MCLVINHWISVLKLLVNPCQKKHFEALKVVTFLNDTVNVERLAGVNIHGFNVNPMKFLQKYSRGALATCTIVYCLPTAKNSQDNFCGTLKNHESLAQ